jgi:hypothetical protein
MAGTPLLIGPAERVELLRLRETAALHPVDISALRLRIGTREGKKKHLRQMTKQTIRLPAAFMVTFSIETGHPGGTMRHMSMSVQRQDRIPNHHAVWMVAQELGFTGGLEACMAWPESLNGHGRAINLVQFVATAEASRA